jgi:hypothetical protein
MEKTYPPITPDEALAQLNHILAQQADFNRADKEDECQDHQEADHILCCLLMRLGADEIIEAYEKIKKWYE